MRKLILLIALLLTTKLCYGADNSVVVHGGWEHTASSAYEDSGTVSVRYERRLYKNLWLGPEYTYHGPMEHHTGNDDETRFDYGDVSGHSILLDLICYIDRLELNHIKPYLIGGIGWSWWEFEESQGVKDLGITVDLGDAWAYKVGGGVTYPINHSWSMLVEWSFFKVDVPKNATHADGSYSRLLGDDNGKIGEEETRLTVGLKYIF